MTRELPDWQPFDPSAGFVSTAATSSSSDEPGGRVVVVAPTAAVERGGWAARAAVALARGWSEEGTKVFLADLSVRRPVLHGVLGVENGEGVSDALLYGTSIRRIAVSTDEPFFFAPAGTVVADPEPVLGHPRWEVLTRGFSSAGVTLLLYAPLELPGTRSLLERAGEVVLLATESEVAETELDGADGKVTLVAGPAGELSEGPGYDEADVPAETPEGAPVEGEEAVATEAPGRSGAPATAATAPDASPGAGEPGARAPAKPGRKARRERSSRVEVLVLLLVLVLGGAVVGAYYGYLEVPWLTPYLEQLDGGPDATPAGDVPAGENTPETPPPASPEGEGPGDPGDASSTEP